MTTNEYLVVGLYGLFITALMIRVCLWDLAPREEPKPAPTPAPAARPALTTLGTLRPVDVDDAPPEPETPVDADDLDALWAQATRAWRMAPGRAR